MVETEFVKLERKVSYSSEEEVYQRFYSPLNMEIEQKNNAKSCVYMILADAYGIPHAYDISKYVNKYTSGKVQTPKMVECISKSLTGKRFSLNEDGSIDGLDKILKKVIAGTGY